MGIVNWVPKLTLGKVAGAVAALGTTVATGVVAKVILDDVHNDDESDSKNASPSQVSGISNSIKVECPVPVDLPAQGRSDTIKVEFPAPADSEMKCEVTIATTKQSDEAKKDVESEKYVTVVTMTCGENKKEADGGSDKK